jgi:hypothetical protein
LDENANFDAPALEIVDGYIDLYKNAKFDAPALKVVKDRVGLYKNINLTAPALEVVGGMLDITQNSTFDAPALESVGNIVNIFRNSTFIAPRLESVNINTLEGTLFTNKKLADKLLAQNPNWADNIKIVAPVIDYQEYLNNGNLDYQKPIQTKEQANAFLQAKISQVQKNPLNEAKNLGELLNKDIASLTDDEYKAIFDVVEDKEFWEKIEPIQELVIDKISRNRLSEVYLNTIVANPVEPVKEGDITPAQQSSLFAPLITGNLPASLVLLAEQVGLTTTIQSYGNQVGASVVKEYAEAKSNYQIYQLKDRAKQLAVELNKKTGLINSKYNLQDKQDIWELLSFSDIVDDQIVFFETRDKDTGEKRIISDILQENILLDFLSAEKEQADRDIETLLKENGAVFRQVINQIGIYSLSEPLVRDIVYKDGKYKSQFYRKKPKDDLFQEEEKQISTYLQEQINLKEQAFYKKNNASLYNDFIDILQDIPSSSGLDYEVVDYTFKAVIPRETTLANRVKNKYEKGLYKDEIVELVKQVRKLYYDTGNFMIQEGLLKSQQEAFVPGYSGTKFKSPIVENTKLIKSGVALDTGEDTKTITTLRNLLYIEQNNEKVFGEINYKGIGDWLLEGYVEQVRKRAERNHIIKRLATDGSIISEEVINEKLKTKKALERINDPSNKEKIKKLEEYIGLVKSRTEKQKQTEQVRELERQIKDLEQQVRDSKLNKEKKALKQQIKTIQSQINELTKKPLYDSFFVFNNQTYFAPSELQSYLFYANIIDTAPKNVNNKLSLQKNILNLEATDDERSPKTMFGQIVQRTNSLLYSAIIGNFTSSATNLVQGGLLGANLTGHILYDTTIKPIVNKALGKSGSFNYAKALFALQDKNIAKTIDSLFLPQASYSIMKEFFESSGKVYKTNSNTTIGKALNTFNEFLSNPTIYFVHKGLAGATFGAINKYINLLTKIQVTARFNEILEREGYVNGLKDIKLDSINKNQLFKYFGEAKNFIDNYQTLPGSKTSTPSIYLGAVKKYPFLKMFIPFTGWIAQQIGATASSARFLLDVYKTGLKTKQQKADFAEAHYDFFVKSIVTTTATSFIMQMFLTLLTGLLGGKKEELPEGKTTSKQTQNVGFGLEPLAFTFDDKATVVFDLSKFQNDFKYFGQKITESFLDDIGFIDSEMSAEEKIASYQILPIPNELTSAFLKALNKDDYERFSFFEQSSLTSIFSAYTTSLFGFSSDFVRDNLNIFYSQDGKTYRAELKPTNELQRLLGAEVSLMIADMSGNDLFRPEIKEYLAGKDIEGNTIKKPRMTDWKSRLAKRIVGADAIVNLDDYRAQLKADIELYNKQRAELIDKYRKGKISPEDYNEEVKKLELKKERLGLD